MGLENICPKCGHTEDIKLDSNHELSLCHICVMAVANNPEIEKLAREADKKAKVKPEKIKIHL